MNIPTFEDFEKLKKEILTAIHTLMLDVPESKVWLNNKEACEFLNCKQSKLERLRNDGKIPFSKNDGTYLYHRDDLNNYLWSLRICLN